MAEGGEQPAKPGEIIDGRYRIERLLGRGGMGEVYAAEHLTLKIPVAVKFLVSASSPDSVERFSREAQIAARLSSPHVTRVLDVATPPGRSPYLVMELLSGRDLDSVLSEDGPMALEQAVGYVLEACDALAEAHQNGVIHRDIKPGNLFLARQADGTNVVKVLDFGLSKVAVDPLSGASLSTTTAVMGSPGYMSPEQLRSTKKVDARTDSWALGVVLYELLSQRLPFRFESASDLLIAIASDPHVPLREWRPELPVSFAAVVDKCLAKKADDRYRNVLELAQALAPFSASTSARMMASIVRRASPAAPLSSPAIAALRDAVSPAATTQMAVSSTVRTNRTRAGAAAIVALAVFAGAGVAAWRMSVTTTIPEARPAAADLPTVVSGAAAPPTSTSTSNISGRSPGGSEERHVDGSAGTLVTPTPTPTPTPTSTPLSARTGAPPATPNPGSVVRVRPTAEKPPSTKPATSAPSTAKPSVYSKEM
ncbi:MAG: protein kinase [Myxococcales bacterium]|nr:protein kinase [Myxococcales bacterium]